MPTKPQVLKRELLDDRSMFKVESMLLRFSNGKERTYFRLVSRGRGAVMVVAVTDERRVVLIREYNGGIEDYAWSLPKGAIDKGEDVLEAANRELQEEVGLVAAELIPLKWLTASPGYMQHGLQVLLARGLSKSRLPGDEPEPIEVMDWPLDKIHELVMREDFHEGRAIAALYLAKDYLDNE